MKLESLLSSFQRSTLVTMTLSTALVVVVVVVVLAAPAALACPKNPREEELTLSQVMRNFGRLLLPADDLVRKGLAEPQSTTNGEIEAVIGGVRLAMTCAEAVLNDPKGVLWPAKALRLPPQERDAYLKVFLDHMRFFEERLDAYRAEFSRQQSQSPIARDFHPAASLREEIREIARKAHEATN